MSELKPCPFCGGEAKFVHIFENPEKCMVSCRECDGGIDAVFANEEAAAEAWNRRARPANEPLTLDQLREMEWYEPVYVKFKHAIPSKVVSNLYDCLCYIGASESNYGKTWIAYRRPLEMFIGVDLASGHDFTAYGRPPERSEKCTTN